MKPLYVNIALGVVALAAVGFGAYEYAISHGMFAGSAVRPAANTPALFVKATQGSWRLRCRSDAPDKCVAAMNVANKANQLVMVWLVGPTQSGGLVLTVQTPTGVVLEPGLDVVFDSSAPHHMAFGACGPAVCRANLVLDNAAMDEMRKASKITASFAQQNGRKVTYTVPVEGTDKMLSDFPAAAAAAPVPAAAPKTSK